MWDNIQNLSKRMDKKFRTFLRILKATDVAIIISYVHMSSFKLRSKENMKIIG